MRHATVLERWIVVNDRECLTKLDKGALQACNNTASMNDGNLMDEMEETQNLSQYRRK